MYSEEHDKIIKQLKLYVQEDEATFGIFQYGGGTDECFIKANKEGLRIFAYELLIAAQKAEDLFDDKKENIIPLNYDAPWINVDSVVFLQYIDPVLMRAEAPYTEVKSKVKDNLTTGGCILFIIFILLSVIVGAASIFKWVF